jgi:hypothetical protein
MIGSQQDLLKRCSMRLLWNGLTEEILPPIQCGSRVLQKSHRH